MSQSGPHDQAHPIPLPLAPWPRLALPSPPASLTPLIGREPEIAAARDLLVRQEVRLVTLTGPGGVGKTRLAQAVAAAVAPDFPDGVAWVSLVPIQEADLVLPALVRALGLGDARDRRPLDLLAAALRDGRLLLVVDNLEQVVEAAPDLAALLAACPAVAMLATSRTLLRIRGEHVLPVPPLPLPDPNAVDPAAGPGSEAVRLFIARATAVAPGTRFTPAAIRAVAEICRRVDGLPLGIELAAARANVLSPEDLRDRLEPRLPLLCGGAHDLPARQRTLRDAIAWSYALLSPAEQTLFRRLSIFVDGFTIHAAEAVAGGGGEGRRGGEEAVPSPFPPLPLSPSVLDSLGALVDQSLVRYEPEAPGGPRYCMLETIREYAADRLAAEGEAASLRRRHADYMLAFAEGVQLTPLLPIDTQRAARLESERGNLRAALDWWDASGNTAGFVRLVAALGWFWWVRGHWREG